MYTQTLTAKVLHLKAERCKVGENRRACFVPLQACRLVSISKYAAVEL